MQLSRTAPGTARNRILALCECLVGGAFVIGHNVYHAVPNEVPLLVALLILTLLLRWRPVSSVGLERPASWKLTLSIAVGAAALLQLKDFVTEPLGLYLWPQPQRVSAVIESTRHNFGAAMLSLLIVWTFAAFGEELGYRALLLRRAADALNGTRLGYAVAILFSSVLFGFGHFYKGPAGVMDSTISGLILAAAYLLSGRNMWAPIFAHGLGDTFAIVYTYFAG